MRRFFELERDHAPFLMSRVLRRGGHIVARITSAWRGPNLRQFTARIYEKGRVVDEKPFIALWRAIHWVRVHKRLKTQNPPSRRRVSRKP